MFTNSKLFHSGQTLIEVMIALFILVTGFLGILSLLSQSLFLSKTVSNETIATYLASEGIELSKNILDHDVYQSLAGLGPAGWAQSSESAPSEDTTFGSGGNFEFDYTACENALGVDAAQACSVSPYQATPLRFDPATDLYSYGGGLGSIQTPFTRDIQVHWSASDPNKITIDSIVSWSTGPLTSQDVQLEDTFYNWQP